MEDLKRYPILETAGILATGTAIGAGISDALDIGPEFSSIPVISLCVLLALMSDQGKSMARDNGY